MDRTWFPRRCVVLDDYEREALRDIQRRLRADDPGFAKSFGTGTRRLRPAPAPDLSRRAYTVMLVVSSGFGVILLLAGSPFLALLFTVLAAWAWWARAQREEGDRQES
ncbi:DUF3040 domain-containing protein [Nonomuraea mesophila]|uniref:DUF3040 domain-containing protein n=1 Tax=Nonomuraea mesophila TaxID=2530382 RepID=A0A4R5E9Z7_9ACTN|nr:DUF3040 domain-containing protein [Nonomuraea mesophila]TDE28983.1 DUF3040 domain-containing protein [Nonomuraea mesophila]